MVPMYTSTSLTSSIVTMVPLINSTTLTSGGLEVQHVNIVHDEDDDLVGLALVEVILGGNDDHFVHNHVDGVQIDLGVSIDLNIAITKTADI